MMKPVTIRSKFKRDYKCLSAADKAKVAGVAQGLRYGFDPPLAMRNHRLTGDFAGWMECHVAPDLLLIYCVTEDMVYLYRVGSHSKLFG